MTYAARESKSQEFQYRLAKAGLDHIGVRIGPCKDGVLIHILDEGQPLYIDDGKVNLDITVPPGVPTAAQLLAVLPECKDVGMGMLYYEME
jgi:hypothetical protein